VSTVKAVLSRSLKLSRIVGLGRAASGPQMIDALDWLNSMLDDWSNQPNAIYYTTREELTLVQGDGDYSIGSSANLNTTRPIKVYDSTVTVTDTEYPIKVITRQEYDRIPLKTTQGIPHTMYYNPEMPNGMLYFYFVPETTYTLNLNTLKPFSAYALSDNMVLPPGYEAAIQFNLALMLGQNVGKAVTPYIASMAASSKSQLEEINFASRIPEVNLDPFHQETESTPRQLFGG